jgi:Trk K+ transport system NAD-binding subunit
VVAPEYISLWVPTFHHPAIPLIVRESYIRKHLDRLGRDEVRPRRVMTSYVAGIVTQTDVLQVFRDGLDRFDVKAVCLTVTHRSPDIRATLRELHFERTVAGPEHEIWVRN